MFVNIKPWLLHVYVYGQLNQNFSMNSELKLAHLVYSIQCYVVPACLPVEAIYTRTVWHTKSAPENNNGHCTKAPCPTLPALKQVTPLKSLKCDLSIKHVSMFMSKTQYL